MCKQDKGVVCREMMSKVLSRVQFGCKPYASRNVARQFAISTRSMSYSKFHSDYYARRQKRAPLE